MLRLFRDAVRLTLVIFCGLLAPLPRSAHSQTRPTTVRIPDAPTCAACSVVLQPVATLGAQSGPGEIDRPPLAIHEDALGRFWFLPGGNDLARVYSAKGDFVRTVGAKGAGPGEFMSAASLMPLVGDSMLVVDFRTSRATVVGADLKPRRTIQFPQDVKPEFALAWPGTVTLQGWFVTPQSAAGLQLHQASLAGRDATILHSFSPDPGEWRRRFDWLQAIRAIPGRTGFWSFNEYRYRFTHWSADRKIVADFERDASWFPRKDRVNPIGNTDTPPAPQLVRIIPGDEQRITAVVSTASPNWKQAWERVSKGSADVPTSSIGYEHLYQTTIEEIDLKSSRVISRTHIDKWIVAAFDGGRVAAYELNPQGEPRVVVYKLVRKP